VKALHYFLGIFLVLIGISSKAQVLFNEESENLGLLNTSWGVDGNENFGGGISFFDFDNDGWDDLTISSNEDLPVRFCRNNNGNFELINLQGISDELFQTKSVQWVDFDNDDDFDLFVTSNQNSGDNRLYENTGNFEFIDITDTAGLSNPGHKSFGGSWGDYNNDSFLDLFVVSRFFDSPDKFNTLYRNNGDGTFTDISIEAGLIQENSMSFCSAWLDYDKDGWQDIYIANDKIQNKNILYHNNQDGTFTNLAEEAGAAVAIDAMSTTIGDYNQDGWLDIYVANTQEGNAFLKNNGDGTFTDVAAENGTLFESVAWSSVFLDADNDTDVDLYVSASIIEVSGGQKSAAYYNNDGTGLYTIPENIGLEEDISISYSNAIGDVDNDGKADIAVLNCLPENVFLWKNASENDNNWLKVKLIGTESNRQGIGSFIEISVNGEKQYNYTLCGEGYLGQNSAYEFFGIGDAIQIDYIKVNWLSGQVDMILNPQINEHLTMVEGDHPLNIDALSENPVSVYPNPSRSIVHISGLENYQEGVLQLVDLSGKVIQQLAIDSPDQELNVSQLKSGIYILNLSTAQALENIKIVKL